MFAFFCATHRQRRRVGLGPLGDIVELEHSGVGRHGQKVAAHRQQNRVPLGFRKRKGALEPSLRKPTINQRTSSVTQQVVVDDLDSVI